MRPKREKWDTYDDETAGEEPSKDKEERQVKIVYGDSRWAYALLAVLPVFGQTLYIFSLRGGSPDDDPEDWVQSNLPQLFLFVVLSSLTFVFGMMGSLFISSKKVSALLVLWYLFCLGTIMGLSNHESTIQSHGAYNAVAFLCLAIPEGATAILVRLLITHELKFRCPKTSFVALCLVFILSVIITSHSRDDWDRGLFDASLQRKHACSIHTPVVSWDRIWEDSVVKAYSMWSWRSCEEQPIIATLNYSSQLLTIHCPTDFHGDAKYSLLPVVEGQLGSRMISWATPKIVWQTHYGGVINMRKYDSIVVQCGSYRNLVLNVPRNKKAVARVQSHNSSAQRDFYAQLEENQKTAHTTYQVKHNAPKPPSRHPVLSSQYVPRSTKLKVPNILVIYLDSISRNSLIRKFPHTMRFFEQVRNNATNNLGGPSVADAFQFLRYHSIGRTTRHNARAMFTGDPYESQLMTIWEILQDDYVTGIIDNTCAEWSAKYLEGRSAIADHRLSAIWCLPEYAGLRGESFDLFTGPWSLQRRCLVGEQVHNRVFEYINLFRKTYVDVPSFLLVKFTEGHEPSGSVIGMIDKPLSQLLQTVDLNSTAVILLSDHGLHMGILWSLGLSSSILENKLPGWFMLLPKWWTEGRNSADGIFLQENEQALVTPFNIFGTLLDLAGRDPPPRCSSYCQSAISYDLPDRNCPGAGIPDKFCGCS
ncbi:type I phosphodiesterase/nucleotide pyrophosphatase [Pelomyxa schiedti]|nr:type I phosphodiesterase/nucleotide pyrophosphatase [Pelomyxa schiedti]